MNTFPGHTHVIDAGNVLIDLTDSGHTESKDTVSCNIVRPQDMSDPVWRIGDIVVDDKYGRLEDSSYLLEVRKAVEEMDIESRQYSMTFSYQTKVGVDIFIRQSEG